MPHRIAGVGGGGGGLPPRGGGGGGGGGGVHQDDWDILPGGLPFSCHVDDSHTKMMRYVAVSETRAA